jgi:glycine betaine/choline ABC-type transport system substrate-binding protein
MSTEFQNRETTIPQLGQYPFDLGAPFRGLRGKELFPLMEENKLNIAVTTMTDGHLTSQEWKVLEDDRKAFPAAQAALLVRDDLLAQDGDLRPALNELTGKISIDAMRKMNAAVEIDERRVEDVAAEFLKSAGLP